MIIQCEQCRTKFKLDDSKVADKSIKVRCARCKHVFSVSGSQGTPDYSAPVAQDAPVFQFEEEQEVTAAQGLEPELGFEPETTSDQASSELTGELDAFAFESEEDQAAADTFSPAEDDSDFSLPSAEDTVGIETEQSQKDPDDLDFGAFDFGDDSGDDDEPAVAVPALDLSGQEQAPTPRKEEFGGLDFSGDDMFGDVVSAAPEEEPSDALSFDMGADDFSDSMGVENRTTGQGASLAGQDQAAENPFSLDDIDFGDELTSVAVQQVSTEELKPGQDLLFAPLAETQTKPAFDSFADTLAKTSAAPQDELPPLSISSRRKDSPRTSGMLVFMGIIIAGLVIFYSTWGYMMLTEDKGKIAQETGRITVRSVEASFVKNKTAGDLLVISGEAVNEFTKARAAIEIKGIVFGAKGEEVASKSAFCGNPLSKEQLSTMSMDKIEAAMANQFGDSLANMEVAPGDAIPFVIVMTKPPAGSTDYGVEPVGSTVATEKSK